MATAGGSEEKPLMDNTLPKIAHDDGDKGEASAQPETPTSEVEEAKEEPQENNPPGGFDSTPVPHRPPGYTLKFTFHRAENLPIADVNSLSSDPYIVAQINTQLPTRHKEDPPLRMRSKTIRRDTNPKWNWEWIVAHVPASGFRLKARIYDEDPADHDDRLGNVHITVARLDESWGGIHNKAYDVKMRMGSKRAYSVRALAVCIGRVEHMRAQLYVSVEMLGRSPGDEGGRCYTLGPLWWTKHYSPLLGRIANRKESMDENQPRKDQNSNARPTRYNFQANQLQLCGPVPAELYHRYVEFRPIIKYGFTNSGFRGFLFNKALHGQHARVYGFDRTTEYGVFPETSEDFTRQFLDLVRYDRGGRIFTYVLTLDALWRFTETGKEFGIDMLSKHTMHSDVSIYIAFSGEFFVRRRHHHHHHHHEETPEIVNQHEAHSSGLFDDPPDGEPPTDPSDYELVIDNDSGTYRPNADLLPLLKKFLEHNLPGLHIMTLDCQKDAEKMAEMKEEQRARKEKEGGRIIYTQLSGSSSESSSDEEILDAIEADGEFRSRGVMKLITGEAKVKQAAKKQHLKQLYKGRPDISGAAADEIVSNATPPVVKE